MIQIKIKAKEAIKTYSVESANTKVTFEAER